MAKTKDNEKKAASGPAENKANEPKLATTEQGEQQVKEREERKLGKDAKKRQEELAQSGYRVPDHWYTDAEQRQEHDEAVAKNMQSTRPADRND